MTTEQKEHQYIVDRSWFVVFSVAFVFGIVWMLLGDSGNKLIFTTAAFIMFLKSGIDMEMSARALSSEGAH